METVEHKCKLSVIIPMYNERKIAADTVKTLRSYADSHPEYDFELLFVNDGSRDDCAQIAEKAAAGDARVIVTGYPENHGKGRAVRFGMLKASGDIRVFTDCDLAYGCDVIVKFADALRERGCGVVIGSRNLSSDGYEGYTPMRRLMSKTYIKVIALAAGFKHTDSQSGIKCFSGEAAEAVFSRCEVDRFAFDLEALIIAEKLGFTVTEYGVKVINHRESESKVNPVKDTLRMLGDIRKIKKRVKNLK